jgi:hypothetical protein
MNRVLLIPLALLAFSCASAKERTPPEQLEQWMAYYYLDPRPEDVAAALQAVTAKGFFENDNVQAPLTGFFTEVFRANPKRLDEWIKPYIGVPDRHILYSGLWMANSKESKAALERLAKGATPEEAKRLRGLLASPPPTIESMDIDSPALLDYLWGCFSASGAEAPVLRVIDQIKLVKTKGDVGTMMIGGAAKWSVSANARQHDKVLKIVKARAATADAETKEHLAEILKGIEAEKSKK